MDSALRPREIQARIRSGQSLEEVAREAGVPAERIEPFAAPVLAEREHVAGLALAATVRRRGETSTHRNLRPVVAQRLTGAGIDPDEVDWDAWREEDRRWSVRARYRLRGEQHDALFRYDQAGRFSVALNDDARWLIAEPTRERDDSDELALVRAVSSPDEAGPEEDSDDGGYDTARYDDGADEITQPVPERRPGAAGSGTPAGAGTDSTDWDEQASAEELPTSAATPQEIAHEVEAEIDSYGVVPDGRSELDVLYDMLGGLAEDSINIYAGLSEPVLDEAKRPPGQVPAPAADAAAEKRDQGEQGQGEQGQAEQDQRAGDEPERGETVQVEQIVEVTEVQVVEVEAADDSATVEPDAPASAASVSAPAPTQQADLTDQTDLAEQDEDDEPTNLRIPRSAAATDPAAGKPEEQPAPEPPSGHTGPPAEPEQPSLVDLGESQQEPAEQPTKPAPKPRKSRKRRASVPSWDEIMFGGPPPSDKK